MEVFFFFILKDYSYSTAMACSYDTKITALTGKALSRQGPRPRKKPRGPLGESMINSKRNYFGLVSTYLNCSTQSASPVISI